MPEKPISRNIVATAGVWFGVEHRRVVVAAVRAHLLELAGDAGAARAAYLEAARSTLSAPERRYLESRAAAIPTA